MNSQLIGVPLFHTISDNIKNRMNYLEQIDARDRKDGTPRLERLRQIPPETGKFISLLAANSPNGEWIEIGTSAGYSTLWLVLACIERQTIINTFEVLPEKVKLAKETFQKADVENYINLTFGDAREYINNLSDIAFCFLDAEKEVYEDCYDLVVPKLVKGGTIAADNAINHQEALKGYIERAHNDTSVDSLIVPIGKGVLVTRKI